MASTCKYCGADTWGRYQLCPDCRKERKREGVYRSSHNTLGGEIKSGSRYFCNTCQYRWESRKKYGAPAFCPKCSSESILLFEETPEGKKELFDYKEALESMNEREKAEEINNRKTERNKLIMGFIISVIVFIGFLAFSYDGEYLSLAIILSAIMAFVSFMYSRVIVDVIFEVVDLFK